MSDIDTRAPAPKVPAGEANGQLIVSLAIVAVMGLIGLGLIIAAAVTHDWSHVSEGVIAIIAALASALNTPGGISSALRAAAPKAS